MFSNGMEFEAWKSAWCDTCVWESDLNDCQILSSLIIDGKHEKVGNGPLWSMQTVAYCTEYLSKS